MGREVGERRYVRCDGTETDRPRKSGDDDGRQVGTAAGGDCSAGGARFRVHLLLRSSAFGARSERHPGRSADGVCGGVVCQENFSRLPDFTDCIPPVRDRTRRSPCCHRTVVDSGRFGMISGGLIRMDLAEGDETFGPAVSRSIQTCGACRSSRVAPVDRGGIISVC